MLILGTLLGGLGLFLLAVSMITDGLKLAAGDALHGVLVASTSTPARGIGSGILVTGIVQSSSAVTVATIGFVNAGLLNLRQALGVVYGANIGTTMTGWLVAAVGFDLKIEAFALPLIGLGMAARLIGGNRKAGALGEALAGFGLFFVGVDVLRGAFQTFAADFDLAAFSPDSFLGVATYVGAGFLATLVTQSSSAAIAITLTAATGGVLAIDAAAAMVIGANVGTTSTAALSVIGATPNAKRVAGAHVVFNFVTAVVALLLLPILLWGVDFLSSALGLARAPAVTLAVFHTTFNVLGVLLMWGLTPRLARFLNARFRTAAEAMSVPQHLDNNVLVTPALALDALTLELQRIAAMARSHSVESLRGAEASELRETHDAILSLNDAVETFVGKLGSGRIPRASTGRVPVALRINTYIEDSANLAQSFAEHRSEALSTRMSAMDAPIKAYLRGVEAFVTKCGSADKLPDRDGLQQDYEQLDRSWHDLKSVLLDSASRGDIPLHGLNLALERLRSCLRIAEATRKCTARLLELQAPPLPEEAIDRPEQPAAAG